MIAADQITGIASRGEFDALALRLFCFQAEKCAPYREYVSLLGIDPATIRDVGRIPFLPIRFFRSRDVYCGGAPPQITFTSSGTTSAQTSRHPVADVSLYETSFTRGFELFYGNPADVAIFALLPGYLERQGSSLVYMADKLSRYNPEGGFFIHDKAALAEKLAARDAAGKKSLLIGVTFALLEMAQEFQLRLKNTMVMETGGMKGHGRELPRQTLHAILCRAFGVGDIHSEYGMTELLSQAYSSGQGLFRPVPWMRVSARELNDPFRTLPAGAAGGINIIDLANVHSCAFIETEDLGTVETDGSFRIAGRIDRSILRGCNMLI